MYKIYINHFKRNNGIVDTEEEMFSIPSANGFPVQRPTVKCSEDAAENFSFSMESSSPYYDALMPLKTTLKVIYDGPNSNEDDIIFYGRVLTIGRASVFQTKSVTCEGWYSVFKDTYYEGQREDRLPRITVESYLDKILANHRTNAPDKNVVKGTIGVTLPTDVDRREPTSWGETGSLLSGLTGEYGGHMRIRHSGSTAYLDWYKYYVRDLGDGLRPSVKVTKNILDISTEMNAGEIFTRVIPIGSSTSNGNTVYIDGYRYDGSTAYSGKAMPVPFIRNLYTDVQLTDEFHDWKDYRDAETNYGVKYKTMSFPDANTQEKLWNEVKKWIKECYFGVVESFTVKAIDMHITHQDIPKILFGECVDVTYLITKNGEKTWETRKLICKSIQYDLLNPENNSYTFSVPSDILNAKNKRKKSSKKQTASAQGSKPTKPPKSTGGGPLSWQMILNTIGKLDGDHDYEGTQAYYSFQENGELAGTGTFYDPEELDQAYLKALFGEEYDSFDPNAPIIDPTSASRNIRDYPNLWFDAHIVGKITLPGKSVKYVAVSDTRGLFAYVNTGNPNAVAHWYTRIKGYSYTGKAAGISTFEQIAKIIEKDTSAYGGTTAAAQFRSNGAMNSSVHVYDPESYPPPTDPDDIITPTELRNAYFTARLVGKFGTAPNYKFVGTSTEHGIFAFNYTTETFVEPAHWYTRIKGQTYDNIQNLIDEDDGSTYGTDDGTPVGNKTVKLDPGAKYVDPDTGEEKSAGQAFFGIDLSQPSTWKIKLNVPMQYVDADGNNRILPSGGVVADDIQIEDIPSFKTKLAVMDVLIAGKVNAVEIEADRAYITHIRGGTIDPNTSVSAYTLLGRNIYADNVVNSPHFTISSDDSSNNYDLIKCFSGLLITKGTGADAGKIIFNFVRADGTAVTPAPFFNIADTQFFQDQVAAAWNNGGATAYFTASRTAALDPGQSSTLKAYYTNHNGLATASTVSESGKYSTLTIQARNLRLRTPAAAVVPSTSSITVEPGVDTGGTAYDGLARVVVSGDANLVAGNIKSGVSIFGVAGSYDPRSDAWNAARDIIVNSLPTSSTAQAAPDTVWNLKIPNTGYDSGSTNCAVGVATNSVSYTYNGTTMRVLNTTVNGQIAYRKRLYNLEAGNIKSGVSILGVSGTYENAEGMASAWNDGGATSYFTASRTGTLNPGQSTTLQAYYTNNAGSAVASSVSGSGKYSALTINARSLRLRTPAAAVVPSTSAITVEPGVDTGGVAYDGLTQVVVAGDADLVAGNIKNGVSIFGVTGSYDPGPTAWNNGGATAYFTASRTGTLNPGQSTTLQAYYTSNAGLAVASSVSESGKYSSLTVTAASDSNLTAGNIKNGVDIFGVTGTYGGSNVTKSEISVGNFGTASSGDVEATTMRGNIINAIYGKTWFSFKVTVTHNGSSVSKTYYMNLSNTPFV